jgi:hypothetical protein
LNRGGFVVWRAAQWHSELVTHVFSVCTPYSAPQETFISTEDLVKGPLPQFAYQLHLASGEVEKTINDEKSIRQFLKGMYGGKGPDGEVVFEPEKGVLLKNLEKVGDNRLLNGEVSDDFHYLCEGREILYPKRMEESDLSFWDACLHVGNCSGKGRGDGCSTKVLPYPVLLA